MASPETICGKCRFFRKQDASGNAIEPIVTDKGKIDIGFCKAPMGMLLGRRESTMSCKMSGEIIFEPLPVLLTQNPAAPQESPAL